MSNTSKDYVKKLLFDAKKMVPKSNDGWMVAMAIAATTKLNAQAAGKLMNVPFSSSKIGLKDKPGIKAFKKALATLLPDAATAIAKIPDEAGLHPADIADYLGKIRKAVKPEEAILRAAPAVFVKSATQESRKKCADRYGSDFASKASDRLVQALDIRSAASPRESVQRAEQSMVIEFTTLEPSNPATAPLAVSGAREWLGTRESVTLSLREPVTRDLHSRTQKIGSLRESFYSAIAPMRADLERKVAKATLSFRESANDMGSAADVCWLNGTMRTVATPKQMGDVAADAEVSRIGIPRMLLRDISMSGRTVGAVQFRVSQGLTGKEILVAVIDGEVDSSHPSLLGRVLQKKNYTKEAWGRPDEHGTGVAGIIGSSKKTLAGMAPGVIIANYKVFAATKQDQGSEFDATLAIQQALEDGVQIANCSWGVGLASDGLSREARAFNRAWDLGLVIVKSAGNLGPGAGTMTSPADARGVIVVGATSRKGKRVEEYSSRGPIAAKAGPDFVAPGGSAGDGIRSLMPGGRIGDIGVGTSLAAPHVTGLVALLLEQNPSLTPDSVRTILRAKCVPIRNAAASDCGAGLIRL